MHFPEYRPTLRGARRRSCCLGLPPLGTTLSTIWIAEEDKVVARITGYGTHEGEILSIPATHKPIQGSGIVVWRIKRGKIVEHWAQQDTMGLMQQLRVVPPPR